MNEKMWLNAATQANAALLKSRGVRVLEVESGELACGVIGAGRLCSLQTILDAVEKVLGG